MRPITPFRLLALLLTIPLRPVMAEAQFRYPPMYPGYRLMASEADLRLIVKPKEASVYVDGYFAGKVEDFDGRFQRLHLMPGEHEIVVYLEGYRSLRQKLYLSPNTTRKIEGTLERLPPGEAPEPQPAPPAEPARKDPYEGGQPPNAPPRPPNRTPPGPVPVPPRDFPRPSDFTSGTLSIQVQPSGGTVLIDGERWTGPSSNERLIVQVPEGRHTIEVQRDGYDRFATDVDVRNGETTPVNISLTRAR